MDYYPIYEPFSPLSPPTPYIQCNIWHNYMLFFYNFEHDFTC